jgi:hypothetical protein
MSHFDIVPVPFGVSAIEPERSSTMMMNGHDAARALDDANPIVIPTTNANDFIRAS